MYKGLRSIMITTCLPVEADHGEVLGPAAEVVVVVDEEEGVGAALQVRHRQQPPFQPLNCGGFGIL